MTMILYIILYLLIGLVVSTYIMTNEVGFTYTMIPEFILTIAGALLWPVLLALFIMSLIIHYIYLFLCHG